VLQRLVERGGGGDGDDGQALLPVARLEAHSLCWFVAVCDQLLLQ